MTALLTAPAPPPGSPVGKTTPRLYTRPLAVGPPGPCGCGCALSPRTSLGFECIAFAVDVLGLELLPWQRWWLVHAFELVPDERGAARIRGHAGMRLRFRTVVTLVARQCGKTTLLKIVALWLMYLARAALVLGCAQSLDIAQESWAGAVDLAEGVDELRAKVAAVRRTNGQNCLTLTNGARYRITAASRSAGRGLPVDVLILDELREHRDWLAWGALSKTTMARPDAITVCISNAGDAESVVLNSLRAQALAEVDDALALFEWSAPEGCDLADRAGWAQAIPGLGITITESAVASALATDPPAVFRTELLCQYVDILLSAITAAAWGACADPGATLAGHRDRLVLVVDAAPDGRHVSAVLAAPIGTERVQVQMAGAWDSTAAAMAALPGLVRAIKPQAVGWYPVGPGAVLTADMEREWDYPDGRKPTRDSPDLVRLQGADVTAACQGLVDLVDARRIIQPKDPLLDAQTIGAQRKDQGDGFRFVRVGAAHVDAVYAMAGAAHIARGLPPPLGRPMVY